jgi:hypothetical protein
VYDCNLSEILGRVSRPPLVRKRFLCVDCNKGGFSPGNIEASCRVGQSTKKGGDNATRYVGEKGIGFKSVFKAADIVWIKSGHYSFKFDKSQPSE